MKSERGTKLVYVAHPISGDVEGNIKSVLQICKEIHTKRTVPFAPYIVALQYLNDDIPKERRLGADANAMYFKAGIVDELWLYGDKISPGMAEEVVLCRELGIPIRAKSAGTMRELKNF